MKLLYVTLTSLALVACGGGDPQDATLVGAPHAVVKATKPTGGAAIALHLYQAFYGKAPGYALMTDYTAQATSDAPTLAAKLATDFASTSHAALAKIVLDNLGVTATTVKAVNSKGEGEFALLLAAVEQLFGAYPTMRGQVILNMTNLLEPLEADATYGAAAVAYNNQAAANSTYATNSANTSPAVVPVTSSGGGTAGSAIGSGLYTAVLPADNIAFLALLKTACTTKTDIYGGTIYSKCNHPAMAPFTSNLTWNMYLGGLPNKGAGITSGPSSYTPGISKVTSNQGMTGVAVNDSCTVGIGEPMIPIMLVQTKGANYYAAGVSFTFRGTDDDSIMVISSGVVSEYTMTNGQGGKIEVHPNLALFDPKSSGAEAVVGTVVNGSWTNYYMCN
jgi:hypothetical protein